MSTLRTFFATTAAALFAVALTACEGTEPTPPGPVIDPNAPGKGFFLLNEGGWGGNNSTLDFYDYATETLHSNIFEARNPTETMGLGDLGNDLAIHDGRLFAVMNGSGLVHVMDAETAVLEATIAIEDPRYIAFSGGFAYVTSYGDATLDDPTPNGFVAKIDLRTFKVVGECEVGRQPDGLAMASASRLYVCNSGGYGVHETEVSVIDLGTFTVVDRIEVAPNLGRLAYVHRDGGGALIASSWDSAQLFMISPNNNEVTTLPIAGSTFAYTDRAIFAFGTTYDAEWNATVFYNTFTGGAVQGNFITDGTEAQIVSPYGLAIEPETEDILVTDAANFTNDGKIYCFSADGKLKWSKTAGVAPSKMVFN